MHYLYFLIAFKQQEDIETQAHRLAFASNTST